jgi:hypothetical protein
VFSTRRIGIAAILTPAFSSTPLMPSVLRGGRFYARYGFVAIGDSSFAVVSGADAGSDLISNDLCRIVDYCELWQK